MFSAPQQPPKHQVAPQAQDSDMNSGLQSIEDFTGMGFCSPNYSPIPQVRNTYQQQPRISVPTSTPIAHLWLDLNTSDLTHNRRKVKIIDSFTESQEPPKNRQKEVRLKAPRVINTRMSPNWVPVHRPSQMANGGLWFTFQHVEITKGRTTTVTPSALNVGPNHTTRICATHLQNLKR